MKYPTNRKPVTVINENGPLWDPELIDDEEINK